MKTCTQVKAKGGRGKKAPYKTVSVRCPEPVKAAVMRLIQKFHDDQVTADDQVAALKEDLRRLKAENALLRKGYTKVSLELSTFKAKVVSLSYLAIVSKFGHESFDVEQLEKTPSAKE